MKKINFLVAFLLIFAAFTNAQTWTKLAVPDAGKTLNDLVIGADGNIYALTSQGLYKSTDDAATWTLASRDAVGVEIMAVSKTGKAFLDRQTMVLQSSGGETEFLFRGIDNNFANSPAAVALSTGKVLYMHAEGAFTKTSVYKTSTDDGVTFTDKNITTIQYSRINHGAFWSDDADNVYYYGKDKNLYLSTDKGETFAQTGGKLAILHINRLAIDRKNGNLYKLNQTGSLLQVEKSTDKGVTWTVANSTAGILGSSMMAYDNKMIAWSKGNYLVPNRLFYSSDGGVTWTDKSSMFELYKLPTRFVFTNTGKLLGMNAGSHAVVEVDFATDTWKTTTKGMDYAHVKRMDYNGTRLAASFNNHAFYTDDMGVTWKELKGKGAINDGVFVAKNGTVYTASKASGTWAGVYRQDANDSMVKVTADADEVWNFGRTGTMFEDDKGNYYCHSNLYGMYKSSDGKSFTKLTNAPFDGLGHQESWFSAKNKRIYSSVGDNEVLHYSDDYGVTWTKGKEALDKNYPQYTYIKSKDKIWAQVWSTKAVQHGFYHSDDVQNWTGPFHTTEGFDNRWAQIVKGEKENMFYAANFKDAIRVSSDTGKTWNNFEDGIDTIKTWNYLGVPGYTIPYLKLIGNKDKLFLSTNGAVYWAKQEAGGQTGGFAKSNIKNVSVFPNPSSGRITIRGINNFIQIDVINSIGQKVSSFSNPDQIIDISHLKNGMYFLIVSSEKGLSSHRIQVQH